MALVDLPFDLQAPVVGDLHRAGQVDEVGAEIAAAFVVADVVLNLL
jgi:hypothetical protein